MLEEWRDVAGYEGVYQVSSLGRVQSLDRYVTHSNGVRFVKGKIMTLVYDQSGYLRIRLNNEAKGVTRKVHRLVAETFIPNPENKSQIDHINTIKDDNRVENLRWVSPKENSNNILTLQHKAESMIKGKDHHYSKRVICEDKVFNCIKECSDHYEIRRETMARWLNGTRPMPDRFKLLYLRYEGDEIKPFDESESEEARKKIKSMKMANSKKGQKAHNSKKVVCGLEIFESIKACADFYNVNNTTMQCWLNRRNGMPKKFKDLGLNYADQN